VGGRHTLTALSPETGHFFHFTGDWTDIEKLTRTGVRTPGCPVHSEPFTDYTIPGRLNELLVSVKKSSTFKFAT
jgi:hypothetical protein